MASYEILNVRESKERTETDKEIDVYKIDFEIDHTYRGSVKVPIVGYTNEKGEEAVKRKVKELLSIMKMKGTVR